MRNYTALVRHVCNTGTAMADRTGVGTKSVFGTMIAFDLRHGFPATTVKRLAFKQVKGELAAFLRGATTLSEFQQFGCSIWDGNGEAPYWIARRKYPGDLGRIYGAQWRDWRYVSDGEVKHLDQLTALIGGLKTDPYSRRHLLTTYNPGELGDMCLPPCHLLFQVVLRPIPGAPLSRLTGPTHFLDGMITMRSLDLFLGAPFDIASYALLMHLICNTLGGVLPRHLKLSTGDTHIYNNHFDQVSEMLKRPERAAPTLKLHHHANVFNFLPGDAELLDYNPHPAIKAELNV